MLNQVLYDLLTSRFGNVHVANEGQELVGEYKNDPIKDRVVLDIFARGETYCIDCPYCKESRNRLYISHRYGVWDEITRTNNMHMVRCFNEECFKRDPALYKDLHEKVFGLLNREQRQSISYTRGFRPAISTDELVAVNLPGTSVSLMDLPPQHPATKYLREDRGYDVDELIERHDLHFCLEAGGNHRLAARRIVIPVVQDQMLVGWQCRYVGDVDWKAEKIPKYFTMPTMPKRLILYNHDTAVKQDMVIVTEGPTSCWAVYPYGVAILGKQATIQQQRLLIKEFGNKTIIILLDGDAKVDADRLHYQLKPNVKGTLLKVELPRDRDPGSYYHATNELWDMIYEQADKNGVELPVMLQ